ncbi:FHA domain-containing protein [Streptomyces sp. NPDC018693]|uniref:FHA domain-containing protein n=1 Tax=unclassified Streptomyces TaxID=2593676 RepID=UPI0037AC3684
MQIRLTVVDPQSPPADRARGRAASCDVLVTAPAGTALAAVASALATAVSGEAAGGGAVVLYAGAERLDTRRSTLGEPPLTDGAVLSLGAPADPEPHPEVDDAPARLHVVAGPDAGGVHLLHGGQVRIGRSADADVPLDDPDVSRLHCAVTLGPDGRVTVADLNSTNGTTLDGTPVRARALPFPPGALLRIGESTLRLTSRGGPETRVATIQDGEGHMRVPCGGQESGDTATGADADAEAPAGTVERGPSGPTGHAYGTLNLDASEASRGDRPHSPEEPEPAVGDRHRSGSPEVPQVPGQARPPHIENRADVQNRTDVRNRTDGENRATPLGPTATHLTPPDPAASGDTHGGRAGLGSFAVPSDTRGAHPRHDLESQDADAPHASRKRGGLSAWARRLAGGRAGGRDTDGDVSAYGDDVVPSPTGASAGAAALPETWPDLAALLLTALGPGPRLWERAPGHPEALTVRLGTADRPAPDGSGLLPAVPVTAGLREVGSLGLAGPRERLSGLARAVLAQLAALHSPDTLEIVLLSTDPSRPLQDRTAEWSWLGWLPHVRPGHGQDCRLLLAHDREQATARTGELLRRLEEHPAPAGHRPSWARADTPDGEASGGGPYAVLVVDGDPGSAALRAAVARLALDGPRAGIHVVCLAETAAASPSSPVTQTYEAACAAVPVFRECGAVALLSGDVATALRLLRVARSGGQGQQAGPVGHGTMAAVDAVSLAWAERFARALAPLRPDGGSGERHARVSVPLPQSARLLDELGLARATPASLMARWADAADDTGALGGRATAVLGAGPRGPVGVDLAAEGPHLLVEGPPGSGRTELLRALVASLAAAERPDRLGMVLMDGRDSVGKGGAGHGDGLRVCTDVPHVTTHLTANDPVRMREFAQSLSAELKRRAELLGRTDFAEWHRHREVSGRLVPQRGPHSPTSSRPHTPTTGTGNTGTPGTGTTGTRSTGPGAADLDAPPSSTLRLRPGAAARRRDGAAPPLPRLVVVVDDLDALVSPALGSPGRPAAGSVMRALEAVARDGERLGVHLIVAAGPDGRTADSEPARRAGLRVTLDAPGSGADEPTAGRGRLTCADGRTTGFQGGRVSGRIPRTATLRPTVVPLEWHRMGDPPARRPVRELGNGPTDLALLASALERAAREVSAAQVPSLL